MFRLIRKVNQFPRIHKIKPRIILHIWMSRIIFVFLNLHPPSNHLPECFILLIFTMIETIEKYFPSLTSSQRSQFEMMMSLYPEWNAKINVISRKDIDNLEVNHILHSLAIAKYISFTPGSRILDFGTGGGFPGIPLAVMFPEVHFHLVDRTGKKVKVAKEVADACGIANVSFQHGDVAECREKFDFVVSRAVMPQPDLVKICRKNISPVQRNALPNGLITLKGGELSGELKSLGRESEVVNVSDWFSEPFFDEKRVVYTPIQPL